MRRSVSSIQSCFTAIAEDPGARDESRHTPAETGSATRLVAALAGDPGIDGTVHHTEHFTHVLESSIVQQGHVGIGGAQRRLPREDLLDQRRHPLGGHAHKFPVLLPGAEEVGVTSRKGQNRTFRSSHRVPRCAECVESVHLGYTLF